ncbi:hypothetical protein KI387_017967 [Taxus chinensis]|uniref:Aldehyde oxidase/xanthine dehydrogenase a/b hammerhead domain-containing protein n=1 Tax=Taxus chinensis TaxID=29808 RepID=A0AA38LFU9_TAXCH|nr:hypothetical protein KI387_017967 [Taxus chinensis]
MHDKTHIQWEYSVDEEMDSLEQNQTWDLVKLLACKRTLQNKWVYRIKEEEGGHKRYKARLVIKVFSQKVGIEFGEIFSHVVKMTSIRTILSLAAVEYLHLEKLEVKMTFLHGDFDEDIYMQKPFGYEVKGKDKLACRMKKEPIWAQTSSKVMIHEGNKPHLSLYPNTQLQISCTWYSLTESAKEASSINGSSKCEKSGFFPEWAANTSGCGACVVFLSKYNTHTKETEEFSISSCLTLLGSIDGCSITTSEGLGNCRDGYHAIHKRIAGFHASQCGYCTPGWCMSLYGALFVGLKPKEHTNLEMGFQIFRYWKQRQPLQAICAGVLAYRPIADVCKSFAGDVDLEDLGLNSFWKKNELPDPNLLPKYNPTAGNANSILCSHNCEESRTPTLNFAYINEFDGEEHVWVRPSNLEEILKTLEKSVKENVEPKLVVGQPLVLLVMQCLMLMLLSWLKFHPNKTQGYQVGKNLRLAFGAFGVKHAIRATGVEEFLVDKVLSPDVVPPCIVDSVEAGSSQNGIGKWSSKPKSLTVGKQAMKFHDEYNPVGQPSQKVFAELQASGEAVYVDDIPAPENCLYGAFVLSEKALALINKVDVKHALESPTVVSYISSTDIPKQGRNLGAEAFFGGEVLFAEDTVEWVGQPIGLMVAKTWHDAKRAADKATVEYDCETLGPPILSVEDAGEKKSFFEVPEWCAPKPVGDFAEGMSKADHRIESAEIKGEEERMDPIPCLLGFETVPKKVRQGFQMTTEGAFGGRNTKVNQTGTKWKALVKDTPQNVSIFGSHTGTPRLSALAKEVLDSVNASLEKEKRRNPRNLDKTMILVLNDRRLPQRVVVKRKVIMEAIAMV